MSPGSPTQAWLSQAQSCSGEPQNYGNPREDKPRALSLSFMRSVASHPLPMVNICSWSVPPSVLGCAFGRGPQRMGGCRVGGCTFGLEPGVCLRSFSPACPSRLQMTFQGLNYDVSVLAESRNRLFDYICWKSLPQPAPFSAPVSILSGEGAERCGGGFCPKSTLLSPQVVDFPDSPGLPS